jgi:hypothetical protein
MLPYSFETFRELAELSGRCCRRTAVSYIVVRDPKPQGQMRNSPFGLELRALKASRQRIFHIDAFGCYRAISGSMPNIEHVWVSHDGRGWLLKDSLGYSGWLKMINFTCTEVDVREEGEVSSVAAVH